MYLYPNTHNKTHVYILWKFIPSTYPICNPRTGMLHKIARYAGTVLLCLFTYLCKFNLRCTSGKVVCQPSNVPITYCRNVQVNTCSSGCRITFLFLTFYILRASLLRMNGTPFRYKTCSGV